MRKLLSLSILFVLALAGCGGDVTLITSKISPAPTVTLDAGQSQTFTATVANDSTNSGVRWVLNGLGTLSNQTTTAVVYTAPTAATTTSISLSAIPVKNALYASAAAIVVNAGVTIATSTLPAVTVGVAYGVQIIATGGTGALTFSVPAGTLPGGLTLSSTGYLSGVPTSLPAGPITVTVTDAASTPVSVSKVLPFALTITTNTVTNAVSGTAYSAQLNAVGGTTPYAWSVTAGALPTGLTLSAGGVLSGTTTQTGTFTFTATVKDSGATQQAASKSFTFLVYTALKVTTTTLPQGSVKNAYTATLAASGGNPGYTWSLATGSTLPAGLTLSSAGLISGTPTAAFSGSITVQVKDTSTPQQTATATLPLTIVLSTLAITTTSLPQGTVGVVYSAQLASSGGNPPVTWSLAAGSTLPTGLTLSSAGVISGTPMATNAGTTFVVQATDSTPATVTQTLSITVVALAPLTVSTTTLPAGNIGSAYSAQLAATGGATPYTWTLASGALPAGLTLSSAGLISGTPVAAGSYTFTAQVKDSQSTPATASRSFTLTVGTTLGTGAGNAMLNGSYAFLMQGYKNAPATGAVAGFATIGSLSMTGSGTVTGVEDVNAASGVQTALPVTGTYSVGTDGRGLMVLTAGTTTTVYTIAASNLNGAVAQSVAMTEFDNSTGASGTGNASGFAKLQTTTAFNAAGLKGTYAFGLSGESPCAACATGVKLGPLAAVGVFTADGVSAITAGSEDAGAYATSYAGATFAGSYTAPAATTGRGTITVTNSGALFAAAPTTYTVVVVNAGEVLMMSNGTHATTSLLAGDARLQTATALSGVMIGYESVAANGDGATTLPTTTAAVLDRVVVTGSGTATLAQDVNRAGVFSSTAAAPTSMTFTTAANGRMLLGSQVFYPYAANAGFAVDSAVSGAYAGLTTYERQVVDTYPPFLSGTFAASTLASAAPATDVSGDYVWALSTGGVNSGLNGTLATTLDSSAPNGTLTLAATGSSLYLEDATGRITLNANGSTTVTGVAYAISSTRAVGITAGAGATPIVTVMQK